NAIKQDVFHYVYGHSIPDELVREIEVQLLRGVFVKRDLVISHTIEPYKDKQKYVLLTTDITYSMHNLTNKTQTYHLLTFSEDAPEPELQDDVKYLSIRVDDCVDPFVMDGAALVAAQNKDKIGGHLCVERDIKI